MQAPDPIETILARLMPPALSQECHLEIETLIDDLAGPENVVGISWLTRCVIGGGIAAAIGALCAVFPMIRGSEPSQVAVTSPAAAPSGLVLVSKSDRIESVTDEGWREDSEGSTMHAVRIKGVQENEVRDKETGMLVRISEPREEILMMPVGEFYKAPVLKKPLSGEMVEAATLPPASNGPVRVVNVAEKSASFSANEGCAVVRRDGDLYKVKITGSKDEVIFEGSLSQDGNLDKLPVDWHRRIQVLCRTLDQALDGSMMPQRQPQPRLVPPVSPKAEN
ncbi:MAG: hypothetical protein V4819_18995 [Verrucomicrobiota bacterium]